MEFETTFEATRRADLLPATLPFFWVLVILALAILAWVAARWATRRYEAKLPLYGMLIPRFAGAVIASWAGFQVVGRFLDLACRWPVWIAALVLGVSVEAVAALYKRERRVVPKRLGTTLSVLRSCAITLAMLLLMQPVHVRVKTRHIERRVAVLMDESESMWFEDRLWTASEKLAWGREFGHVRAADNPLPGLMKLDELFSKLQPWASLAGGSHLDDSDGALAALLEAGIDDARAFHGELDACVKNLTPPSKPEAKPQRDVMEGMMRLVWNQIGPSLDTALKELRRGGTPQLLKVTDALKQYSDAVPSVRLAADEAYWMELPEAARGTVDALCATTRVELARQLLLGPNRRNKEIFLDRLAATYDVDLFRLGHGIRKIPRLSESAVDWDLTSPETRAPAATTNSAENAAATNETVVAGPAEQDAPATVSGVAIEWDTAARAEEAFRMTTDFAMALEAVQRDISSEMLAGVLIVSDGIHNGMAALDPIARSLGAQRVPVMGVRVGGSRQPFDVAVADVTAPESIFLGDNVRVRALMRATNAKGQKINVDFVFYDPAEPGVSNVVETVALDITSDVWQRELRFKHLPEERGIVRYEIRATVLEGELFEDNNAWSVDVAVSDDRTNVLLVDGSPNWEFRYLRNLFYGRDKSVHLQYYVAHPDTITDVKFPEELPPASASRAFGEAEAGALPESLEEWRKFDIIILGDIEPGVLSEGVLADIEHCVSERGAMLVVVAGPNHMPHAYLENSLLRKMLPVTFDPTAINFRAPPDREGYTLALTPSGKGHPVMQQSPSLAENDAIWQQMPNLVWRVPVHELRPGAEVLAYAQPVEDPLAGRVRFTLENAAEQLEESLRLQNRNALIVASRHGRGKILSFMFDRTWRFRYRVGDTHHHRFWGQVMRWGVGEKLRDGDEFFRVGTDKVAYMPGEPVQVMGRVLNRDGSPARDVTLLALITPEGETENVLARQRPVYREDSNGLYEAEFKGFERPGRYTVHLHRRDMGQTIETQFLVTAARRPVELANVAATDENLLRLARLTSGRVVEPDQINQLLNAFGAGRQTAYDLTKRPLWDNPLLFILIVGLLTAEWILRKKGNLV
ncbi:MAG: hypothetical protein FWF96_00170 [Kiritimatiellaeota bacterium]|nr:hypothetical protein [Kiritimatiellota bacterium]